VGFSTAPAERRKTVQLVNDFVVDAPLEAAWAVLTDVPQVVECIPGAQLESTSGDDHHASVTVKVGPVGLTLTGIATIVSRDDALHQMVVRGTGRDRKGNGSAEAAVTVVAEERGGQTAVTVTTDLELGGRIAQFGSGVISQVSNRILGQFASRLNARIAGTEGATESRVRPAPAARLATTRTVVTEQRIVLALTALAGVALGLALGRTAERLA
jgi:carbon monoxide dehydrogenase subunit G